MKQKKHGNQGHTDGSNSCIVQLYTITRELRPVWIVLRIIAGIMVQPNEVERTFHHLGFILAESWKSVLE